MSTPTRFPSGVSTAIKTNPLGQFGMPDPTKWHVFFDDFDTYTAADWTVTEVGVATQALADGDGGLLLITNAAADNDSSQNQKVGESFLLTAGKKTIFKARLKVSDATQSDLLIGLAVLDTTLIAAAGDGVTDGVFFQKDDGVATLDVYCQKDTTTGQTSATSIATLVSDTFVTLSWYYNGVDSISYYVNDVHTGTLSATSTYLPDTELTVSFAIQNGEAVAKTQTIDYVFVAQER
jgi:hypothetical protein